MFKRLVVATIGLTAAVALGVAASAGPATAAPSAADDTAVVGESAPAGDGPLHRWCAQRMHDAVVEDNAAYEAKDAERYEAILHPDMLFVADGEVTYGRDAVMATARQSFAVPGWHWRTTILSETLYDCSTGVAVLLASTVTEEYTRNYHVTMTMIQRWGTWTVAMDGVHLIDTVYH